MKQYKYFITFMVYGDNGEAYLNNICSSGAKISNAGDILAVEEGLKDLIKKEENKEVEIVLLNYKLLED